MIRYRYATQVQPPAPYVSLTLRNPQTGAELHDVPALLDSAADRTLLPDTLIHSLGLLQMRTIPIGGVGGKVHLMPTYPVEVAIHNLPSRTIEAVSDPNESYVLLGRDVLNSHRILLDGPQLKLEIG